MASIDAAINLIVNGGTKIDKIINKAAQLESIVNDINKKPLEVNVAKVTSAFDTLESNLKATRSTLLSQQKAADQAANSIDNYTDQIVDLQRKLNELNPNTKKYNDLLNKQNEAIKGRAAAEKEANASLERIEKTQRKLVGLEKDTGRARVAKEAAIAVENLADSYLRLGSAQQKSANESSIASLSAQAEALKLVANNSQVASSQFNRFAIATQAASQKIFEARQKQLGALAFGLSPEAPKVNVGRGGAGSIAGARGLVGSLIASGSEIVKSEAALSDYAERLRALQSLVPYTSNEFRALEEAIAGVNQEISQVGLRGQKSAIQALSGPATDLGTTKAVQLRESFQKKVNDQLNVQDKIQERISQATLFDFQKKKLTLQLDEAVAALAENRLGDAQRLTREIDRQRISMERMNRAAQKPQVFGVLGTAFMPVTGELPGGNVPGSPAARAAEAKANRESTQAAVALAKQKQKAIEDEAEELRKGTQAATALGKQKLKALQDEAERLRQETSDAVALAQQKMREEERAIAQAWKMRGGPELPPSMGGGTAGVRGQAFRAGGPGAATAALSAPRRVESLVRSAQLAQEKLLELEIRGVDVTGEKASVQKIINSLKEKDLQISDQLLNNADDELNLIRDVLRLEKQRLTNQRLLGGGGAGTKAGPTGTGLEQALKNLQEARGARQAFLGGASPAQAIDQIVREFNKGASGGGAGANVVNTLLSETTAGVPKAAAAGEQLGRAVEDGLNDGLGIQSPSKVATEAMLNVINTLVNTARSGKAKVQAALEDLVAPKLGGVQQAPLVKSLTTTTQEAIDKLANFIGRASARPSLYRPLARLAGSELLSGGTVPQAMQRKAFEAGKILPETRLLSLAERRSLRGSINAPGGGLEGEILRAAVRGVSGTGAFVGPLASSIRGQGAVASRLFSGLSQGPAGVGGTGIFSVRPQSRIGAPGSAFPFQGYRMGGAQQFPVDEAVNLLQKSATRGDANRAVADAIKRYRNAVNNFWEGEDSQFEAVSKVIKSSVQLGGARFARKLTESGRGADLSRVADVITGEERLGISKAVGSTVQRISDSVLNSIEALGFSVSNSFEDGIDRIRSGVPSAISRGLSVISGGFGGGGGGGRLSGGGGGAAGGGSVSQVAQLLGFDAIADISRVSTRELEALSAAASELRAVLDPAIEGFDRLDNQLRETIGQIGRQIERRAPEAGFLTRQFGPRTARGLSEGLIGGAFPLLFGQGLGAAVGGGAGGFAGGFAGGGLGFGLSLVGTALGTAFDTAVQSATELGAALQKPVENFDKLAEKSFFSSKALENAIGKSIEYGDAATASALIQEEAIKKLGVGGVQNLKNLGTESDRLNRAFAELGQQMQAVAAGPLSSVIGFFADIAGQAAAAGRVRLLRSNLNEQQAGQFNQEILGRLKERGIQRGFFAPGAPTESEIGMLEQQGALQDIVDKFQPLQLKGNIKIDPKQQIQSEVNVLQKQLETIDISKSIKDQVRSAAREQQDLDKQRADLVRSYEESIGNIRKQVEDKIAEERKRNAQLELDIRAATADLELQKLKEANREFRGIFSDTLAGQTTERVLDAVESITQIQNEGAAQRANLELQIQNTAIETEKYKVEVANQVAKLNEETARRVSDINEQVRRRNEEFDQNRFTLEKRIAELQLKNNEILTNQQLDTAKKNVAAAEKAGDQQQAAYAKTIVDIYQAQLDIIKGGQKEISKISAPAALGKVAAVGGGGVATSGIDSAVASGIKLQQVLRGVQDQILSVNSEGALLGITESLNKQIEQADLLFFEFEQGGGARSRDLAAQANLVKAITEKIKEQKDATSPLAQKLRELLQFEDGRYKIINLINQAQAANTQIQALEDLIAKEEELKVAIQGVAQINGELLEVDKVKLLLAKQGIDLESDKAQALLNQAAVVDELSARYRQLTVEQQMQQELLDGIAGAFASTVGGALDAAVDKTKNFGDALKELGGDLLQTIGKMLIMQGIAQLLGALGGGAGNPQGILSNLAGAFGYKFANGGYFANGVTGFAGGGMFTNSVVSSPTLFRFADGGALRAGVMGEAGPEAIMPLERGADGKLGVRAKLGGAMNRYRPSPGSAAAKFESNFNENNQSATGDGVSTIDVRYTVERINSVDYVTADQFQQGMQQAAAQGAARGEQATIRRLQQSRSTRSRLGISQ